MPTQWDKLRIIFHFFRQRRRGISVRNELRARSCGLALARPHGNLCRGEFRNVVAARTGRRTFETCRPFDWPDYVFASVMREATGAPSPPARFEYPQVRGNQQWYRSQVKGPRHAIESRNAVRCQTESFLSIYSRWIFDDFIKLASRRATANREFVCCNTENS